VRNMQPLLDSGFVPPFLSLLLLLLEHVRSCPFLQNGGHSISECSVLQSSSLPCVRQARFIQPGCKQIRSKLGQTLRENSLTTSVLFFHLPFTNHFQIFSFRNGSDLTRTCRKPYERRG